jgi:hypothetical protein
MPDIMVPTRNRELGITLPMVEGDATNFFNNIQPADIAYPPVTSAVKET